MRRPLSLIATGLIAAATCAPASAQESVLLRMDPPAGQATRYRIEMQVWMSMSGMPGMREMMQGQQVDTTQPMMVQTIFTTDSVRSVEGDVRAISTVIDSVQMDWPGMPMMRQMGGNMAGMMRGMTTIRRMDSRGRVISTEITSMGGMGNMPGMGRGGRYGMGGSRSLALPEGPVRVGDTWTSVDTTQVPAGPGGQTNATARMTYRLERLERQGRARVAVISVRGELEAASGEQMATGGSMSGEVRVDLGARRMVGMTMEMSVRVQNPQTGGEMPVRTRIVTSTM
jgi:hypothetical protein